MGRIVPPFRRLYQETVSDLTTELKGALVDLGHKSAFDLLLKEAWNPEQAAMGNSTLPTVCDKLNVISTIHLRKLIAALVRENGQRDAVIGKLEERIGRPVNVYYYFCQYPPTRRSKSASGAVQSS